MAMRLSWLGAVGFVAIACLNPLHAHAQGIFAGTWTIDKYADAPWKGMDSDNYPISDPKLYLHQTVVIDAGGISGTSPVKCAKPHYRIRAADKPEDIFHNGLALGDMNTASEARKIGITTKTVRTLATGCGDLEFHMAKPDTIVFGLPDRIFLLSRSK